MVLTKMSGGDDDRHRADESYNRFVAIASLKKQRFADDNPALRPHQAVIAGTLPHLRLESG
ncbi:hypothetical protein ACNKHP_20710 [Shigella boydii]